MECNHDCGSCGESCADRESENAKDKPHPLSNIKKVIGIVSGKGGVGKSTVTALLASAMRKKNKKVALLDADVTGPSIPKLFGLKEKAMGSNEGIFPVLTKGGMEVMSVNLLLEHDTDPVVWRGPVISGAVKQFWSDVIWNEVDYMFVDMPPGTGDVALTVFGSLPVDGVIIVTSPQELSNMVVAKAIKMAQMMNVPILGIVENMSYIKCPDCGRKIPIFGESKVDAIAMEYGIPNVAKLPIDKSLTVCADSGKMEEVEDNPLNDFLTKILKKIK